MRTLLIVLLSAIAALAQTPPIDPGVSLELAKWRAANYSDVRYKLNLTLEKMSPVLKGTMEIRVKVGEKGSGGEKETSSPKTLPLPGTQPPSAANAGSSGVGPIILDWRKIKGHEKLSTISNVELNGTKLYAAGELRPDTPDIYNEYSEHLLFSDRVKPGENVIKLDFTSPILTSGSAITRYIDKEDGSEYIYSLFVPSDASTAFPVFDQPDLKARFQLDVVVPKEWKVVSNTRGQPVVGDLSGGLIYVEKKIYSYHFQETKPISTYVFAFAAGPFAEFGGQSEPPAVAGGLTRSTTTATEQKTASVNPSSPDTNLQPPATAGGSDSRIYVRKSQAAKFKPHTAEVFRLNREAIKYFEEYFDYKFPFPKYDIVLIPEFPFGGMEHAGATFLRETSIIFPQEPTKSDHISRANLIFHEAAHQWFGDTVTMRWFDDLWLKEGFATFMAYKALEKVMPEANAWKVFYERVKQAAYQTDSTRGTTPIYQEIKNLSAAKSAYGNIVYNKAPAFLRQAEFYLGEDKFQTAVRAFLKKHEFRNAGWEDLVAEFEHVGRQKPTDCYSVAGCEQVQAIERRRIPDWANAWVKTPGLPIFRTQRSDGSRGYLMEYGIKEIAGSGGIGWPEKFQTLWVHSDGRHEISGRSILAGSRGFGATMTRFDTRLSFQFPNYGDYGYGIFLLDDKSRDYVLKNIQNEKDPFLRSMMWGALWDSVREGELDPKVYVELAIKNLPAEQDETIVSSILGKVSTAMNYYLSEPPALAGGLTRPTTNVIKTKGANAKVQPPATAGGSDSNARLEAVLLDRLQNAPTPGQRITFYRAFVANASTAKGREVLKEMLQKSVPPAVAGGLTRATTNSDKPNVRNTKGRPPATAGGSDYRLRTKDKFDIVQRLIILGDPDALKLLADLEKTETTDDAKRYAYAARAGIATAENKAKYWNDFVNNKDISESWIEASFGPWNSIRHSDLTIQYLQKALAELPNHKRNRKIFFINGWLAAFIGGQRSEEALAIVNKFLADNPNLDRDLRLKILENVDLIERAVKIRGK